MKTKVIQALGTGIILSIIVWSILASGAFAQKDKIEMNKNRSIVLDIDGGPNCLSCHDKNVQNNVIHKVDGSAIDTGTHANLNSGASADPGLEENKKCWGCHQTGGTQPSGMGDRYQNPYKCYDCHIKGSPVPNVPIVDEHFKSGIDIKAATMAADNSLSCLLCHNLQEMKVSYIDSEFTDFSLASHYGKNRNDLRIDTGSAIITNCYYCHQNTTTVFSNTMVNINNNYIPNHSSATDTPKCIDCHNEGKLHDSQLVKNKLTNSQSAKLTTKSLPNDADNKKNGNDGSNGNGIIKILSLSDTSESSLSKTDKMSRSFSKAATKNPDIFSIQTSVLYSGTTNACISCHNDTGYPADTDGNGIAAPYKRPHNDTVMCEYCHGSNPHSVKYIQPDGSLGTNKATAATCIDCHQTGTVPANNANFSTAYVMGNILRHSNDPNNGSLWNRTGDPSFWSNQLTACLYCHNDTKHDIIALGKPSIFKDTNVVRQFGTWCTSCHQQGYSLYSTMLGIMNLIPPEITGHITYGNYPGNPKYFNHNGIGSFQDTTCKGCHGNRANVTALMHNVSSGQSGPDCVSCHDVSAGIAPALINESAMSQTDSIHKDLNKDVVTSLDPRNKKCWSCHGDGNEPAQHPLNYKSPATCTDCHAGSNTNFTPSNTILTVSEHYWNGEQIITSGVSSCYKCHNKSEMMIVANDPDQGLGDINGGLNGGNNSTSHYGKKRNDLLSIKDTRQYCDYCHNSTTSPSTSFFDVFIDVSNRNIQNHSAYGTNPKCQDCHNTGRIHNASLTFDSLTLPNSTFCLTCHGPGGTASINNKSKHNNTVDCSVCHLDTGKDIHPIKYLNNTGGFGKDKLQGVKCDRCHESGLYDAPAIGKLQHSDNTWNGSLWDAGRPSIFWNNNTPYTACLYCHGDTKHNATALGKPNILKGTNVKNVFGTWCGICHYQGNAQYSNMTGSMNPLVPPEITKHATYGNYITASDGTNYFNHSLTTYNDTRCGNCHYSGTPANLTKLIHDTRIGGTSCTGCHPDINATKLGRHVNVSKSDGVGILSDNDCRGCHFNVLTLSQMVIGYANFSNTYFCQDCHTSSGRNPSQYNNITDATLKKGNMPPGHAQNKCQQCHIAGDDEQRPLPDTYKYHTEGPKGPATGKNCYSCHYRSDGGNPVDSATIGLNYKPFNAPGEDHRCDLCHGSPNGLRPSDCAGSCHSSSDPHTGITRGFHSGITSSISGVTLTPSSVVAGGIVNVNTTITNKFVQVAKAQYRINNSANNIIIRDWTEMNASDGQFNNRIEDVTGNIDTTGLSGNYTVLVRGMISGSVGGGHNSSKLYYPDNGVWISATSVTMQVNTPFNNIWAGWTKLDGTTKLTPGITKFNDRLYATVIGTSEREFIRYMDTTGTWTAWSLVSPDLWLTGPSISEYNSRLYAMAVAKNNSIYINSMGTNGVWSGWQKLSGGTNSTPSITTFNNRLYATVLGTSDRAFIQYMNTTGTWSGWSSISPDLWLTGPSKGISIAEYNGRLYAMVIAKNNSVYINNMGTNGVWSGWQKLAGTTNLSPDITPFNTRLYATVIGTSERAFIQYMNTAGTWSGWSSISPDLWLTGPSISEYNGRLYEMAVAKNNSIYVNSLG